MLQSQVSIWLFTKIQTVLRLTTKFPRILREAEIHLSILLGNQNFLAQSHNIHLSVGTPLLLLPFPCGKRLQSSQNSHKGSLLHRTCGIPGCRWKTEDWLPWKMSRHRAVKPAGSKSPTRSSKFPLLRQEGKGKRTLVFDHIAQWWEGRRECVGRWWRGEGIS